MIHVEILIILILLITGSVSMSLLFIVYYKEKYALIRYHLVITLLMTILVTTILVVIYLYTFQIFPKVLYWLRLFANLVFCALISQWIVIVYPAKAALRFRIADRVSKAIAVLLCAVIVPLFFFYEKYFFLVNLINIFLGIASLVVNMFIVYPEKNPVIFKDGINWNRYTKIVLFIYAVLYPAYAALYFTVKKTFDLSSFLAGSIAITPTAYLLVQLFSIIFLIWTLMKPHYKIKSASVDPSAVKKFGFSEREAAVASKLIEGLSYQSIGQRLFISQDTVKTHIQNIYRKTGVNRRQDLIRVLQSSAESTGK